MLHAIQDALQPRYPCDYTFMGSRADRLHVEVGQHFSRVRSPRLKLLPVYTTYAPPSALSLVHSRRLVSIWCWQPFGRLAEESCLATDNPESRGGRR